MFEASVKQIQVKFNEKITTMRSNHGTEFKNAKFNKFCIELGISHYFSDPRTP